MLVGCSKDNLGNTESQAPQLIAVSLDPSTVEPERNIKTFQDIASFFERRFDTWNETYRNTKLTEEDRSATIEYIELLINEFNYEILYTYHFNLEKDDPFEGTFSTGTWEVCLGLASMDTGKETKGMTNKTPCDIDIHSKKGKLNVWFTDLFHTKDYVYRSSKNDGSRFNDLFGQRLFDEYYLKDNRYYNGSDNILSVEAGTHGEAAILINNDALLYSTNAFIGREIYVDYDCDDYVIHIKDFIESVNNEEISITVPMTLIGEEIYTLSDGLGVRGNSPIWAKYNPGEGTIVRSSDPPTPRATMNAFTLRVLQWNKEECIVYISMDIITELEPMTIEILAAMPAYGILLENEFKKEEAVVLKVGETMKLEYNPPYTFMPNYETYEWKITSGQGASITSAGDTSTITAVSPGQIVVKCVYSYGTDEEYVLTGITRNENHTRSKLYYIEITK